MALTAAAEIQSVLVIICSSLFCLLHWEEGLLSTSHCHSGNLSHSHCNADLWQFAPFYPKADTLLTFQFLSYHISILFGRFLTSKNRKKKKTKLKTQHQAHLSEAPFSLAS